MNYYIESNHHFLIAKAMLEKVTHNDEKLASLRAEYKATLLSCRDYIKEHRKGSYNYLDTMPCGYGDAFGDKVDQLFRKKKVLKGAFQLSRGIATEFYQTINQAIGG